MASPHINKPTTTSDDGSPPVVATEGEGSSSSSSSSPPAVQQQQQQSLPHPLDTTVATAASPAHRNIPMRRDEGAIRSNSGTTLPSNTRPASFNSSQTSADWADFSETFESNIAEPGRKAFTKFFYPSRKGLSSPTSSSLRSPQHRRNNSSTGGMHSRNTTPRSNNINNTSMNIPPSIPGMDDSERRSAQTNPASSDLPQQQQQKPAAATNNSSNNDDDAIRLQREQQQQQQQLQREQQQEQEDLAYVEQFWTAYDDIIILSLFTQLGILCRLGAATFFAAFDQVFHKNSALFTNLPLNCLSCFVMGLLCSGESLMSIIATRFTPPRLQQDLHRESGEGTGPQYSYDEHEEDINDHRQHDDADVDDQELPLEYTGNTDEMTGTTSRWRRRRGKRRRRMKTHYVSRPKTRKVSWQPVEESLRNELREVQLLALERRIRMSSCLVLFPVKKQDIDVVESYFRGGYQPEQPQQQNDNNTSTTAAPLDHSSLVEETAFSFDNHELALDVVVEEGRLPKQQPSADASTSPTSTSSSTESSSRNERNDNNTVVGSPTLQNSQLPSTIDSEERHDANGHLPIQQQQQEGHVMTSSGRMINPRARQYSQMEGGNIVDYGAQDGPDLDEILTLVATDVTQQISRISKARLADGWDVGTTPEEKSADVMLGLRDGLCGALSSFSSWISSMVNLLRTGQIGQAFVGLTLGIQLPIMAYRFGQHIAVYIFVWRCRRETKRDERRGYGIRLSTDDGDGDSASDEENGSQYSMESGGVDTGARAKQGKGQGGGTDDDDEDESGAPSVRAIATALFIMSLVAQVTSLSMYYDPEDRLIAISLLFSPLGVLTRWRLMRLNEWRPNFPIGTFTCNIAACALSGTLGTLLAGNPGPRERLALVGVIAGFGGTLSSVARFIVEILEGVDPILFRVDGMYYAIISVGWGVLISFLFSASGDWADATE